MTDAVAKLTQAPGLRGKAKEEAVTSVKKSMSS